jgi:hypothetical protein
MMLNLRPHIARDYSVLPDMDKTAVGTITEKDQQCLDELGGYLVRDQAWRRFGATLLHSHFPVKDSEIFVESVDARRRKVAMRPVERKQIDERQLLALAVRFDPESRANNDVDLIGLEYGIRPNYDGAPYSDADESTLRDVRVILSNHGAIDRFGIRLLDDQFLLDADEAFLESCDFEGRTLYTDVVAKDELRFKKAIETIWTWEPSTATAASPIQGCTRNCLKGCIEMGEGQPHHKGPHDNLHDYAPDPGDR